MKRFGRFVARFWPLYLPLILLFALPFSRPTGRIISDELVLEARGWFDEDARMKVMPAAGLYPDDFDLRLWHGWNKRNDPYDYSYSGQASVGDAEFAKLRERFPDEPLLVAPKAQHALGLSSWVLQGYDYAPPPTGAAEIARENKAMRATITRGQRLDPNNAFWWVALAQIEWNSNRYDQALAALERGSACRYYDDYTLQLARRLIGARERYSAPLISDKTSIMDDARSCDTSKLLGIAGWWNKHAARARAKGDAARALRWGGAMAKVGDLMQRDPNCAGTLKVGASWQELAWQIGNPASVKTYSPQTPAYFARFAQGNGRADLARVTPVQAERARDLKRALPLRDATYYNSDELWISEGKLGTKLATLQGFVAGMAVCVMYLAGWWLVANLLLWRARAAPSTRRDRATVALGVVLPLLALGAAALWTVTELSASGAPYPRLGELPLMSLALFALLGGPFVLALVCALVIMRREGARFNLAPRIDQEMALTPGARGLLRWFLPVGVAGSALFFALGWGLWMLASWRDWGAINLLAWLPADRYGVKTSLWWNGGDEPYPMVYGILLCCGSLTIWFAKWRWATPTDLRPLTHGALRWWKESLGGAMVVLAWAMLIISLATWPLIQQADARLQRALKSGELAVRSDLKLKS